jgi:hypothetical protein
VRRSSSESGVPLILSVGLEDRVPDRSSFSKNRHGRFRESGTFRQVFEGVVERCMAEGLIGGEGFAVDASVVKADANRSRGIAGDETIDWNNPKLSTRAVREYLTALEESGAPDKAPKSISLTDPAARWTAAPGGPAFFAYSTNYLIDLDGGIIGRCRGDASLQNRRSQCGANDDRASRGALRSETAASGRGYRVWGRAHARLAGRGQAHPHRIFRSGINRNATTAHSVVQTLALTLTLTAINVLAVST